MTVGKIHILHTNDIHSHYEQMPKIAGGIRKLKQQLEQAGDHVVIVDLGDHADRMSSITEGSWGQANVDVLNASGYQLAAIGNNEGLTFPKVRFLSMYERAKFQVLCGNLLDRDTGDYPPFLKPYVIQDTGMLRICWISVTAAFSAYSLLGWDILDPNEQVKKVVEKVKDHVDLIVVLSHTGFRNDQRMAREIPDIDVIIGAHSHDLLEQGVQIGSTFIIQAGKFGQYLGQTTIEFDKDTKEMIKVTGQCHQVERFPEAEDIKELIEEERKKTDQILQPAITYLTHDFPVDWQRESPLGNLLAEGIRDWVGSEISLVNAGQLLFSLPQGPVTKKDLLALCPHPINPCKLWIKGKSIKLVLEESITERSIHRHVKGLGFRGKVLGWICVDGMTIYYDLRRREGERITGIMVNGSPLLEDRVYSVGTVDMFTFGWVFPQFQESERIQYFLPEFIRDVIAKELQSKDALERSSRARWIQL